MNIVDCVLKSYHSWLPKKYAQKGDDGYFMTQGEVAHQVCFPCNLHRESGEIYPYKTLPKTIVSNLGYVALFPFHKAATCGGKFFEVLKSCTAPKVAGAKLMQSAIDGAVAIAAIQIPLVACTGDVNFLFTSFSPELLGWNVPQIAAIGTLGYVLFRTICSPRQFQRTVHQYSSSNQITDDQARGASLRAKVSLFLTGEYTLARLLDMHCRGKIHTDRFEEIKPSKQFFILPAANPISITEKEKVE